MRLLLFIAFAAALPAQTVSRPSIGIVLDPNGDLRSIQGVFSNLLPAAPVWALARQSKPPYVSAAFSESAGAVKTADRVLLTDGQARFRFALSAPEGPALFTFAADGAPRWVYYPSTAEYEDLASGVVLDARPSGDEVLALATTDSAELTVLARIGVQLMIETVSVTDGSVLARFDIPGSGPAAAFEGGWLVSTGGRAHLADFRWSRGSGDCAPRKSAHPASGRSSRRRRQWQFAAHRPMAGVTNYRSIDAPILDFGRPGSDPSK